MGSGIAEAVAVAGMKVVLRDLDEPSVRRTNERIAASLARAVRGGKLTEAEAGTVSGRIELTTDLAQIASAQFVIEAVPEDKQLKLEVLAAVADVVAPHTIITSNKSSIP